MSKKFSQFVEDNIVRQGDISVGLRDGENAQFDFPGDGIKDVDGNYLYKYRTAGNTATNWVEFTNSLTGQPVIVASDGTDENVSLVVKSHADGTLFLISPQNGDIDIALGGSGNINFETNSGYLYVNETDPYDAVSDDTTLAANSSTTLVTQHAVKTYVDGHISTSNFFISTLVASTTDFDATYDNGTGGVGATLTANNNGAASVDGVSLALGNIVLFKDQTSALENGVYVVTQVGDFSNPAIYERYIYFDDSAEIKQGYTTFTVEGTVNAKKGYQVVSVVNTIGVDDIDYQQLTIPTLTSSTDNAVVRFDGTSGGQVQNSGVTITDANILNGATQINVDNLRLDGNTLSTTNTNGDLTIEPNGAGAINLDSTQVFITEALIHAGDSNNNITFGTDTQTFNMGGATQLDLDATGLRIGGANARVDRILTDTTMAAAANTNLYTGLAIKTYVDNQTGNVADSTFITNTNETATLPNSDPLSAKATGILASTTTTGALTTRVLTGTANQIDIANGDGSGNPTYTLSSTLVFPGSATLGGPLYVNSQVIEAVSGNITLLTDGVSAIDLDAPTVLISTDLTHAGDTNNKITFGTDTQNFQTGGSSRLDISDLGVRLGATNARITSISDDTTMAADSSTLGVTQHAAKTYADSVGGGAVTLSNAGTTSLVNDGVGPTLATKGLVAGTGMDAFGTSATDVTINLSIPVSIANGGTNSTSAIGASGTLARSNGTSYTFTTATYPATAGAAGTIMRSDGTNWVNTTTTYPATTSASRILYASSANVVGQITLGTSAVLICNNLGVPSWTTLSNGQLIIGSTAGTPTAATLTQGTGITITNGSGSITIAASGGGSLPAITNSAVLVSTAAGAAAWTSTMTNGQVVIGSTSGTPTAATLTAGTGVTITNGAGTITIAATTGGTPWTEVTGTSQSMAVNNGYIANNAALVTCTLPTTAAVGEFVKVDGKGAGLFKIGQNASQVIHTGTTDTTTGTGGSLTATNRYDCLTLRCITANTDWVLEHVKGAFTIV